METNVCLIVCVFRHTGSIRKFPVANSFLSFFLSLLFSIAVSLSFAG